MKSFLSYLFLKVIVDLAVSETQFPCTVEKNAEHSASSYRTRRRNNYTTGLQTKRIEFNLSNTVWISKTMATADEELKLTSNLHETFSDNDKNGEKHAENEQRQQQSIDYPTVIHFNSISIEFWSPNAKTGIPGSVRIVETDTGGRDDFWNIKMDLTWTPRGKKSNSVEENQLKNESISISLDELLAIRIQLTKTPPRVSMFLRGGKMLGSFTFPNGADAAMVFVKAIRKHTESFLSEVNPELGELYSIEKKQRMRHVAPTLMDTNTSQTNESNFDDLLRDLRIDSSSDSRINRRILRPGAARPGAANRGTNNPPDFGLMVLTQFAKVTQVAREIGDDIVLLMDEKKRRAENERKEKDKIARRRALDIYADIVASTEVEKELPPRLTLDEQRGVPLSVSVWKESFDETGTLLDPAVMKLVIFSGGVESGARPEVWPFILGFFSWDSTKKEREAVLQSKITEYNNYKQKWETIRESAKAADENSLAADPDAITIDRRKRISGEFATYLETEDQIRKDIVRTDRDLQLYKEDDAPATLLMGTLLNIYANYDREISYCQGMSDFLSPIIHVLGLENEALSFWCFTSLMTRIELNFRIDQSGIREQLSKLRKLMRKSDPELSVFFEKTDPDYYSCFRWILVRFKRELPVESAKRLWEVLWTQYIGGDDLHIFIAAALLTEHRRQLLSLETGAFDMLLRYINDMSMRIDVEFAIRKGQICCEKYEDIIM